jgi:hypothetical protein
MIGINVGYVMIPVLLSIYLSLKNKLKPKRVFLGMGIVTLVTYLVMYPDPEKANASTIPLRIPHSDHTPYFPFFLLERETQTYTH